MSPNNIDPTVLPLLVGMVAKGRDFIAVKGIAVAVAMLVSFGISIGTVYTQFNTIISEMKASNERVITIEKDMNVMKISVAILQGQVSRVETNVSTINGYFTEGKVKLKP